MVKFINIKVFRGCAREGRYIFLFAADFACHLSAHLVFVGILRYVFTNGA